MASFNVVLYFFAALYLINAVPIKKEGGTKTAPNVLTFPIKNSSNVTDSVRKLVRRVHDDTAPADGTNLDYKTHREDEDANNEPKFKGPQTEEEEEEEEMAELNPNLFEGDLKLSKEDIDKLDKTTVSKKDTVADELRKWPNGRVPIVLSANFDLKRRRVLSAAIAEFNKKTCVKFVAKQPSDSHFIKFTKKSGCYSTSVGKSRREKAQKISIGRGCNYIGTVIHEMMHAIGFYHEHTRLDRDQYVTVNWNSIEKGRESQFKKYPHGEGDYLGEPYDYDSVMHYPRDGFGLPYNGRRMATLVPKDKPWRVIGQRNGFSQVDINQINKLYKCNLSKVKAAAAN